MISTVTTSTVSTVTTVAFAGSLALTTVLLLLFLLVQKEITTAIRVDHRLVKLNRALLVGIVPLVLVFGIIAALKVAAVIK